MKVLKVSCWLPLIVIWAEKIKYIPFWKHVYHKLLKKGPQYDSNSNADLFCICTCVAHSQYISVNIYAHHTYFCHFVIPAFLSLHLMCSHTTSPWSIVVTTAGNWEISTCLLEINELSTLKCLLMSAASYFFVMLYNKKPIENFIAAIVISHLWLYGCEHVCELRIRNVLTHNTNSLNRTWLYEHQMSQ